VHRGRCTAILRAVAALAVLLLAPAGAQAAFPGANGKIAFAEYANGSHIYTINPDGTGRIELAGGRDPAWSPNGQKIAYVNLPSNHLATMNADGSGQTDLGVGPDLSGDRIYVDLRNPTWSPDGTQIAFVEDIEWGDANYFYKMQIVNSDGSGRRELHTGGGIGNFPRPTWSPDGEWILFDDYCDPPDYPAIDICQIHPDATGLSLLFAAPDDLDSYTPDWSPDGASIAFGHGDGLNYSGELARMDADGTGFQVLRTGAANWGPAWSPDGSRIAFTVGGYPGGTVYVMNADGSGTKRLTAYGVRAASTPTPRPTAAP